MLLTVGALFAARWLRIWLPYGKPLDAAGAALHWPMIVLAILVWTLTLVSLGVYRPQRFAHVVDELQAAVVAISVATLLFAGVLYFSYRALSRLLYVYFFVLDVVLASVARLVLRQVMDGRQEENRRNVLIVGAGRLGRRVVRSLEPCTWMGIQVVGYLDDDPGKQGERYASQPVLGTLSRAEQVVAEQDVREVIIALPMEAHGRLSELMARLQTLPVNIKAVPDYSEMVFFRSTLEEFGGIFFVGLKEPVIGPIDRLLKRAFDVIMAAVGLVLLAPLFLVIGLAVRLTSPGPIFYASRRVGEGGRNFHMYKFRTMYQGADAHEEELVQETDDGRLLFQKREDDPRITPVGCFLRRYSLDELPQLFNVLVGDMSLVGPRPELPSLVEHYEPWQRKRFGVPQGITGWWQISGRSSKAKYEHVEDDLYYIRNYSLLLDLRILWRTMGAVIKGEGAF
jgi:exopolysaccharide biosynthesis polyprenyl glycosylphosphotransferase